jgi:PEP-CTERM motif
MKRLIWIMALIVVAFPLAAFADGIGIDFSNAKSPLTGGTTSLTLTGAPIIGVQDWPGLSPLITGNNLGTMVFSLPATSLTSGSLSNLQNPVNFGSGGTFSITLYGSNGLPNGLVFNGSFDFANVTFTSCIGGNCFYTFSGQITAMGPNGTTAKADFTWQIESIGGIYNGQNGILGSGDTTFGVVPEPGTLGLLGTGLLGIAGVVRRKMSA